MDFFSPTNLLPHGGVVNYCGRIFDCEQSLAYFDFLLSKIFWQNDQAVIFGKVITTKRKVAWYAEHNYFYTYSNITKQALKWTPELAALKNIVEQISQSKFNSCLLNLYHDGDEAMAWHSDDEKSLVKNSTIASLSFGAQRNFAFKHKITKEKIGLTLENGSLLIMKDNTQTNWLHSLPKSKKIKTPRINLTFRLMVEQNF
jgi:alkylated DNA repair dioxygenase AlkB